MARSPPAQWYLFVQSIAIFWFPLTSIASFWSQFQQGLSASERVFALIDAEPRVVQTDDKPVTHLDGRIEFRDVDFRYSDQQSVLRHFNLTIPAGRDHRTRRPYRRGQVHVRAAGRALLRVPGRADSHRWAGHS